MKLGLVSDSHDNLPALRVALARFRREGVTFVLHAGDVASPGTLALFAGFRGALALGNNDRDAAGFARAAEAAGWEAGAEWSGDLDGVRVGLVHGHERARLARLVEEGGRDLVVTGHTHRARDERVGETRVVNPGALWRASVYRAAVFDTRAGRLTSFEIPKG